MVAVAIAGAGISVLAAGALGQLWISLTLCVSFALYGLLRKVVPASAITGLAIETALLFPLAMAWLAWRTGTARRRLGSSETDTILLVLAGIVSTTPCCCSPPRPSACLIRRSGCSSSSPRPSNS